MSNRLQSWELSDEVWEMVKEHIPTYTRPPGKFFERASGGGRKPSDLRLVFAAILFVLRTGIQWNALPREKFGVTGSTVHKHFRRWAKQGVFQRIWELGVKTYDEFKGISWSWQAADGSTFKAPLAQEAVGPNPTDRAKAGSKRHLLVEENGVPLSITITGANVHDSVEIGNLLDANVYMRTGDQDVIENLCLDAAYVGNPVHQATTERRYVPHVRPRGEEAQDIRKKRGAKPRRWIVEVAHSWFNRFRKIAPRYEKTLLSCLGLHQLAAALICFRKALAP